MGAASTARSPLWTLYAVAQQTGSSVRFNSEARCLFPFGDHVAERAVDGFGGAEMRPEFGVDGDDLAHAVVGMVAAARPPAEPRLADPPIGIVVFAARRDDGLRHGPHVHLRALGVEPRLHE